MPGSTAAAKYMASESQCAAMAKPYDYMTTQGPTGYRRTRTVQNRRLDMSEVLSTWPHAIAQSKPPTAKHPSILSVKPQLCKYENSAKMTEWPDEPYTMREVPDERKQPLTQDAVSRR